MLEWVYCMRRRERIEFSEQYLVNCGRQFGLNGCNGGHVDGVADFVNNVGLEVLEDYSYQAREDRCPYDDRLHSNVVRGSHRMLFTRGYCSRRQMLPVMVAHSPVAIDPRSRLANS